ncbi:MAG: hypothetical protein R3B55_01930 [Candidatus Paceibacterota bacterium]
MNASDRQRLKDNPLRILDSKDPNLYTTNADVYTCELPKTT